MSARKHKDYKYDESGERVKEKKSKRKKERGEPLELETLDDLEVKLAGTIADLQDAKK